MRLGDPWRSVGQGGYEMPSSQLTEIPQDGKPVLNHIRRWEKAKSGCLGQNEVYLDPDLEVLKTRSPENT